VQAVTKDADNKRYICGVWVSLFNLTQKLFAQIEYNSLFGQTADDTNVGIGTIGN